MSDKEVTGIRWDPPVGSESGPGQATIGHRTGDDTKAPMRFEDAERMADQFFGQDSADPIEGTAVIWRRDNAG
jgi:hypothetical protein